MERQGEVEKLGWMEWAGWIFAVGPFRPPPAPNLSRRPTTVAEAVFLSGDVVEVGIAKEGGQVLLVAPPAGDEKAPLDSNADDVRGELEKGQFYEHFFMILNE